MDAGVDRNITGWVYTFSGTWYENGIADQTCTVECSVEEASKLVDRFADFMRAVGFAPKTVTEILNLEE
jgi:hypothetical protein